MGPPSAVAARPAAPGVSRRGLKGISLPIDPYRVSLFMLMVMSVSRVHQHFGLGRLRPALLLAIVTAVYALMNPQYTNTGKLLAHWPAKVIAALAIVACLSVPFGLSIGGSSMFIIKNFSKTLIFTFLLIAAMRNARDLYWFMWAYLVATAILMLFAWFVFNLRSSASSAVTRIGGVYTWDSNDLGLVLLIGLPLALLAMHVAKPRGRIVAAILVAAMGATIARTGSRGAFVGIIATGIALLLLLSHVSAVKRLLVVLVAGGTLVLTAPPGYWEQMETLLSPKEDYNWTSGTGRKQVWERGMGYMWSNPLLGIGIANFPRAEGTISDLAVNFVERPGNRIKWSAAHNSFLQAAAELGIPGLLLWSSLVFGGMISMMRLRRRLPGQWARGDPEERFLYYSTVYLPISFVAFASTAFFLSFAYLEPIYILSAYVVGVYVAVEAKLQGPAGNQRPATKRRRPPRGPQRLSHVPAWRRQLPPRARRR